MQKNCAPFFQGSQRQGEGDRGEGLESGHQIQRSYRGSREDRANLRPN